MLSNKKILKGIYYSPIGSILMTPRCGFDLDPKLKASCPTSLNIQSFLMISSESTLI